MKKFLSLIAVAISVGTFAQTEFGVKAGYNLSGYQIGSYQNQNKSYFYLGGLAEHKISEKFSLQGELLYTELGGKDTYEAQKIIGNEIVNIGTQKLYFHYPQLQIPLSAKYYFATPFSLSAGLNFGINLNPNLEFDPETLENKSGKMENIKTLNIFPFIGAEYQFNQNLFADARYHFNFIKINEGGGPKHKIAFVQVGLGYRFK